MAVAPGVTLDARPAVAATGRGAAHQQRAADTRFLLCRTTPSLGKSRNKPGGRLSYARRGGVPADLRTARWQPARSLIADHATLAQGYLAFCRMDSQFAAEFPQPLDRNLHRGLQMVRRLWYDRTSTSDQGHLPGGGRVDEHQSDRLSWRKSTASAEGNCVEVAFLDSSVRVRDSKHPKGPVLSFSRAEWSAFLSGVHGREFELPVSIEVPTG